MALVSADPTLTLTSDSPSEGGETEHLPPSPSVPDSSPGSLSPDCSHAADRVADDDPSLPERTSEEPASLSRNSSSSSLKKLNAEAPEFVPRASSGSPLSSNCGTFVPQQQPIPRMIRVIPQVHPVQIYPMQNSPVHHPGHGHPQFFGYPAAGAHEMAAPVVAESNSRDGLTEELAHRIVKQVEYYFSDANIATNDHLLRFISKDPEGYVPMSVVASFKKIRALISSQPILADALRTSSMLVVSEDGKKVRRVNPLSDADIEDLQSRTVVVENLPEDHSHPNLEKIFSIAGSVKSVRICHPQHSNGASASAQSRSPKMGTLVSNKLHAFVEFETVEQAEKAVSELNDERNWRSGLRVRMLLRRTVKPLAPTRARKAAHDGEYNNTEEDLLTAEHDYDDKHLEDQSNLLDHQIDQMGIN
ncbi:la-related protein 6B-like isoform X2 [Nymphaea colorata]|uniref:la-related protein 6B-like isoform X2 n=1 Tax=Nymphaea colorata TaxID=210225 RepID=UPI00129D9433|nr:la-related protein 6B-like isoform X2 [Nymphaea colorata]